MIAQFRRWLAEREDQYVLVGTTDAIERARRERKLAVMFDIEGMNAIADQPSLVQFYYDLGVRWMLVAYNWRNGAGSGCQEAEDGGLTAFGRQVLDEMVRVGMVACCSHTGHRTTMEVMEYSRNPLIFSHSNARSVHEHPRNVRDEALKACAAMGGVVGINGIGRRQSRDDREGRGHSAEHRQRRAHERPIRAREHERQHGQDARAENRQDSAQDKREGSQQHRRVMARFSWSRIVDSRNWLRSYNQA